MDESYQPLPTDKFIARAYLIWRVDPEPASSGALNPIIAGILADSVRQYNVLSRDGSFSPEELWLLFSADAHADVDVGKIRNDELDGLTGLQGYVRAGHDGTFAEIGLASEELLGQWFGSVRTLATERL